MMKIGIHNLHLVEGWDLLPVGHTVVKTTNVVREDDTLILPTRENQIHWIGTRLVYRVVRGQVYRIRVGMVRIVVMD